MILEQVFLFLRMTKQSLVGLENYANFTKLESVIENYCTSWMYISIVTSVRPGHPDIHRNHIQ